MLLSILSGLLTAAGALLAARWGNADAMAIAWLIILAAIISPWAAMITLDCRRKWHSSP